MEALTRENLAVELLETSPEREFTADELHSRLITFTPDYLEYEETIDRPHLKIVEDSVIQVNGEEIRLNSAQIFFLNALRIHQGHGLLRSDITEMGYRQTTSNLQTRANVLLAKLAVISEAPIITTTVQKNVRGKPVLYELLPEVRIEDIREDLAGERGGLRGLVELNENGQVAFDESGSIRFNTVPARQKVTAAMLAQFGEQSRFRSNLQHFFESIGQRAERLTILPVVTHGRLSFEEEQDLLSRKEKALAAFLEINEEPSDEARSVIIEGVDAFYMLFSRNVDMLEAFGNKYATSYGLRFDDSYQRCAEALLDTIARTGFDVTGETLELRLRVISAIKRSFHPSQRPEDFSAVTIGSNALQNYMSAVKLLRQGGVEPNERAIAKEMGVTRATAKALQQALGKTGLHEIEMLESKSGPESDFVDDALDKIEREEVVGTLLSGSGLTLFERQIVSLHYGLFSPSLAGLEVADGQNGLVEYPRTEEAFEELAASLGNLESIANFLHSSYRKVTTAHRVALSKARLLVQDDPAFDTYGRVSPRQQREEAEEREALIQKAVDISPGESLSQEALGELASIPRIEYLFGSVAEFQSRCGFSPDKSKLMKELTNDEIIERAQKANPEGTPIRKGRILELAAQGILPYQGTIIARFGSTMEFNRQCGFSD